MGLPFTEDQFFSVIERYNVATYPAALACIALALFAALSPRLGNEWARAPGGVLALLWAWMAAGYHFAFFRTINPAAWVFGGAFLVAAGAFFEHTRRGTLRFEPAKGVHGAIALALLGYALVGYPLVARLSGQVFPRVPTFGLPCPTVIFTLGMLLLARRPVPKSLFVVPIAWSAIGTVAAVKLGVVEDYGLPAAALVVLALSWMDSHDGAGVRSSTPSHAPETR
jgi:hypothetical protein